MATVNDLFCGCGGLGLGFQQAGFTINGAWDFDKYAVQSYAANVGDHVKQADITQMTYKDIPKSDVWTFGFPCQDLSVAGKQAGLIEGKRSGLFFEVMRLLSEMRERESRRLPAIILAENVKALRKYLPVLEEEYAKQGYVMYYQLYNSKYWGVPQNRERYFVVGVREDLDKGYFPFPEQQTDFVPKLSTILETNVAEKYYISDEKARAIIDQALKRLEKLGNVHATITPDRIDKRQNGRRAKDDEEEMFTLTAQDLHGVILEEDLQNIVVNDRGFTSKPAQVSEVCPTLRAENHGNHPKVIEKVAEQLQSVFTDKDGVAYCCDANYHKGTSPGDIGKGRRTHIVEVVNERPKVLEHIEATEEGRIAGWVHREDRIFAYQGDKKRSTVQEQIYLKPESAIADACNTAHVQKIIEPQIGVVGMLDIPSHDHSRRVHDPEGLSPTVTAVSGGTHHIKIFDYSRYRVRKLTPTEYGRLQGFPMDTWVQVVSDSQAYKQFGNAVTVTLSNALAIEIKKFLSILLSMDNE